MGKVYLLDTFYPWMLKAYPSKIIINKLDKAEFCEIIKRDDIINALKYDLTVYMLNRKCKTNFRKTSLEVKLGSGDKAYIFMPEVTERGKDWIKGKISYYEVTCE